MLVSESVYMCVYVYDLMSMGAGSYFCLLYVFKYLHVDWCVFYVYFLCVFTFVPMCDSDGKESACNAGDVVPSLGWEYPLEEEMATNSSILAWRIPWTGEPGGLPFMG